MPSDWDVPGGDALSLGKPHTFLANGTGEPHVLDNFSTDIEVGAEDEGTKNSADGDFPAGDFSMAARRKTVTGPAQGEPRAACSVQ